MARVKLVLAFLALLILLAGAVGAVYFYQKFVRPTSVVTKHIEGKSETPKQRPDLGKRHFDDALGLLREGELISARDRLRYLLEYYPESKTYDEAKRILGEVNLDLVVSKIPIEGKVEHVVSSEFPIQLARKYKTTIDYIMRANGKTTPVVYRAEALTMYPLDQFEMEISLEEKRVTLFENGEFFKEYEILGRNLPANFSKKVSTTVSEKVAWHEGRPVDFQKKEYMNCSKWVRTGKMGLFIRQFMTEKDLKEGEKIPYGVMIARADVEELFTILRNGTPVKVIN